MERAPGFLTVARAFAFVIAFCAVWLHLAFLPGRRFRILDRLRPVEGP
jgi:hypothetical protein